ncbi:MAG: ArsR/SmtB family transcription factor [Desulfopila sp.]
MKTTAKLFKALADETRLRIVSLLMAGELCVCDVMEVLQLPQSTVSRHLAYLRNAGLVDDRRQGVWMYYRLTGVEGELAPLLHLLPAALGKTDTGERDQEQLRRYLAQKASNACA